MDNIYTEYFSILKDALQKYGKKTILLMQVGAFLEIYGTSPSPTAPPQQTRIYDVCSLCDLNISEKKTLYQGQALFMAGFRDFTAEKYIQKMVDAGYTVVVYLQEKNEKNATRKLHAVYSAGTYLPYETDAPATSGGGGGVSQGSTTPSVGGSKKTKLRRNRQNRKITKKSLTRIYARGCRRKTKCQKAYLSR